MGFFARSIVLTACLLLPLSLAAQSNSALIVPTEPTVDDVKIPDIANPGMSTNGPGPLYILKATVVYSDGLTWRGILYLTNNVIITFTNRTAVSSDIRVLSLYNLESIRVVRWTALMESKTNLYKFTPAEYRIVGVSTDTNGLTYTGNLPIFNQFVFSDDNSKKTLYTLFYDRWMEGKKGVFRWENSLSTSFPYNFTNPIPGVVVEIDFDRNF